ncbi:MAG: hypothetical protein NTV86_15270 [Planctomycetota bacterium]|nr:hypothetical protein [Planctomycetota bacterium]
MMCQLHPIVCVLVCLYAAPAAAQSPALPEATVTLADGSGLLVRLAAVAGGAGLLVRLAAVAGGGVPHDNLCGAAVNTQGAPRATVAVLTGGHVFLTSGGPHAAPVVDGSEIASARPTLTQIPTEQTSQALQGMGALLARLFGVAGA